MTTKSITEIIVDAAKDQLNLCGLEGIDSARRLLQGLSAIELCGKVPPEKIEWAYQQLDREEADTREGKAPKLAKPPNRKQKKEVLAWLTQPWEGEKLTEDGKQQIQEAAQFLEDYWSAN